MLHGRLAVGLVGLAASAHAQATLRGRVLAAGSGEPLAYSVVAVMPGSALFTDQAGAFQIPGLAPGSYRVAVRHIGYVPFDTTLAVQGSAVTITLTLQRLAVELPPVTVYAAGGCTNPGPPDAATDPALAAVFDQLVDNARRLTLLAESQPFRFRTERTTTERDAAGRALSTDVDTLNEKGTDEVRPYRRGAVVAPGRGAWTGRLVVWLPTLRQFAETAFVRTHCFRLAGRDTIEGRLLIRIDFEPATSTHTADLAGAAYLDSTFQLRYVRASLTHPGNVLEGVASLEATTRFREIAPGIVLQDSVHGRTRLRPLPGARSPVERLEEQRLLDVRFMERRR